MSEAAGTRLDVLDWCISYDPTGPMVWIVAESGWCADTHPLDKTLQEREQPKAREPTLPPPAGRRYRLTTPHETYRAVFGVVMCRIALCVRSAFSIAADPGTLRCVRGLVSPNTNQHQRRERALTHFKERSPSPSS